jgi:hypothetical protein
MQLNTEVTTIEQRYTFVPPEQIKHWKFVRLGNNGTHLKSPIAGESWANGKGHEWQSTDVQSHTGNFGAIIPEGHIVIDCDSKVASDKALSLLPPTFTVQTSEDHYQLYYANDEIRVWVRVKDEWDKMIFEVRVPIIHYVVCPPSMHAKGTRYTVHRDFPVASLSREHITQLCEAITAETKQVLYSDHSPSISNSLDTLSTRTAHVAGNTPGNSPHPSIEDDPLLQSGVAGNSDGNSHPAPWDKAQFRPRFWSIKPGGLTLVRFHNLYDWTETKARIDENDYDVWETPADILRSTYKFTGSNLVIRLTYGAVVALGELPPFQSGTVVFYRASERLWKAEMLTQAEIDRFTSRRNGNFLVSDASIIGHFPSFRRLSKQRAVSLRRDKYSTAIDNLLSGDVDVTVSSEDALGILVTMAERKYSDEEMKLAYMRLFGSNYNESETNAQIKWAKKKAEENKAKKGGKKK